MSKKPQLLLGLLVLVSSSATALCEVPRVLYYHPAEGSNAAVDGMVSSWQESALAAAFVVDDYGTFLEYVTGETWDIVIVSDQSVDPYDVWGYLTDGGSIWILTTQANDDILPAQLSEDELYWFPVRPPSEMLDCYNGWIDCMAWCMGWPLPPDPVGCTIGCAEQLTSCLGQ